MEIILKKTKITSSILKQTLRSTEDDLKISDVLGWCIYNKMKYMILYRDDLKSLSKYPIYKEIEVGENRDTSNNYEIIKDGFWVKVKLDGNYVPLSYTCSDESEKDSFIETLGRVKNTALIEGQFFI